MPDSNVRVGLSCNGSDHLRMDVLPLTSKWRPLVPMLLPVLTTGVAIFGCYLRSIPSVFLCLHTGD